MSKENAEMAKRIKQYEEEKRELSKKKEEEVKALANSIAELHKKVNQSQLSEKAAAAVASKNENELKKQLRDAKRASKEQVETKRKVSSENDQSTKVKKKGRKTAVKHHLDSHSLKDSIKN